MVYNAQAIILSRRDIREVDRLFVLYTKEYGKIHVVAKGIKKPVSKLAGHMEPLLVTNLRIAQGRQLDKLAGAIAHHPIPKLDSQAMIIGMTATDLVDKLTKWEQSDERIFHLLQEFIYTLEKNYNEHLIHLFTYKLMVYLGYGLDLTNCIRCKNMCESQIIDTARGGLLCLECQAKGNGDGHVASTAIPYQWANVTVDDIAWFKQMEQKSLVENLNNKPEQLASIADKMLAYHLDHSAFILNS